MKYLRLFASFVLVELFKPVNRIASYVAKYTSSVIKSGEKVHPNGPPDEVDKQFQLLTWAVGNVHSHPVGPEISRIKTFVEGELKYILDNGNTLQLRLGPDPRGKIRIDWTEDFREADDDRDTTV